MNRALEVANITYFLYGSSLLGSFRHHGQVPWDDSFSVMVNGSQRRLVDHTLRSFDFSFDLYAPEKSERKPWRYFHKIIGRTSLPQHPYGWPNVAIYFFAENATHIWNEFSEPGQKSVYRKDKVFPLRQRPFSSLRLYTPCDPRHMIDDHELEECRSSRRWHKFERPLPTDTWLSIPWIYTFFLSLVFFFFSSSLHNSTCNRDIHFLPLSGFLFSFFLLLYTIQLITEINTFFLSGFLFSSNAGCILSVQISLRLQFGVIEQKYLLLYFLSGVAWDESDKFHHYLLL
ncbi:unnamed protein product [Acanthosepion pharaonis]|uniref:LicD/FKTN/FKRP nucleotidyltransferase domain-containing protein n=1 Tax=Acanthosepion pharaonis TaxID=158019 RepID=A0A812DQV8_ACAPH|nr:unnamed protein product [Sepia pharaonis]